ncbi:WD_REPEATS_REGION domain-containing protein [Psidium guajava]|nr:WD_REPEATS_REGION domain-containing protein [Psidium guajava]
MCIKVTISTSMITTRVQFPKDKKFFSRIEKLLPL